MEFLYHFVEVCQKCSNIATTPYNITQEERNHMILPSKLSFNIGQVTPQPPIPPEPVPGGEDPDEDEKIKYN